MQILSPKGRLLSGGTKTKSYSVTIRSNTHTEHQKFQETEYFKERARQRYKIEAKNSELKHRHGYDIASSSGLVGMELQGAAVYELAILANLPYLDEIAGYGRFFVLQDLSSPDIF